MCTINKSAHTKNSGNLFNDHRVYICIYIRALDSNARWMPGLYVNKHKKKKKEKRKMKIKLNFLKLNTTNLTGEEEYL